jgi:hypothetical protein
MSVMGLGAKAMRSYLLRTGYDKIASIDGTFLGITNYSYQLLQCIRVWYEDNYKY